MQQRIARVFLVLHFVAQHLQYGGQDVDLARQPLYSRAVLEPLGVVDDQRHFEALLIDSIAVQETTVLAEALPMVPEDDEDRVVVEPKLLVLIEEVLQEDILKPKAVEVAVEQV